MLFTQLTTSNYYYKPDHDLLVATSFFSKPQPDKNMASSLHPPTGYEPRSHALSLKGRLRLKNVYQVEERSMQRWDFVSDAVFYLGTNFEIYFYTRAFAPERTCYRWRQCFEIYFNTRAVATELVRDSDIFFTSSENPVMAKTKMQLKCSAFKY